MRSGKKKKLQSKASSRASTDPKTNPCGFFAAHVRLHHRGFLLTLVEARQYLQFGLQGNLITPRLKL